MGFDDLDEVMKIEEASYNYPWSRQGFASELARPASACLVLRELGDIAGFLIFWRVDFEVHILNLAISPDKRRRGLGRFFLEYLLEWGKKVGVTRMFLEVRVSNHAARDLYDQAGFMVTGVRGNYYAEENEDALLMARFL